MKFICLKLNAILYFIFMRHLVCIAREYRTPKFFSICAERGGKRATNEVQSDAETKSFLIYDLQNIFLFSYRILILLRV